MPNRTYLAVTISTREEHWLIPSIPFYSHVGPRQHFPHAQNRPRIEFLTKQRNEALHRALTLYPNTTHIVNIESNYLSQCGAIQRLIAKYEQLDDNIILGAATWARMQDRILTYHQFYDGWATPELSYYRYYRKPPKGLAQVSSVGSCLIFPVEAWIKHGFGVPEPFPLAGIYYNWLCEKSRLPVFLDLNTSFFRDYSNSELIPYFSAWKRVKATLWRPMKQRLIHTSRLGRRS
jgi:hypothetical protein